MTLGELKKGQSAVIVQVHQKNGQEDMALRLLQMGLLEGARVDLVHEAPFGADPIAVRVRGSLIALRRQEANIVEISPLELLNGKVTSE